MLGVELALRSSPSSLSNVEATAYGPGIGLARLCIYEPLLCLDDRSGFALVVDTEHLAPDLKLATFAGHRDGLEELKLALAVEAVLRIELRYTVDWLGIGAGIEVDDLLVGVLEW